ncbi:MAG: flagellar basal body-associated FliL family protein [Spirochaetaceae bacterium]|nr:flagellar basal body-associated FliL family protein [Spirochaetaceae bacterium]
MADKDIIGSMTDDEMSEDAVIKTEKKSSIIPHILKWVAIGLAAIILIVAVSIITVNIVTQKGKGFTEYPSSPEYRDTTEILTYYTNLDLVRTNVSGQPPASISVKIHLGYSQDDKTTPSEISGRSVELQDFLRSYFKSRTYSELESNEEAIKIEIRNLINDNILTKGKIKRVMITQYDLYLQE